MAGTSLIDAEFKADINEYLSRVPNAPVRTLADAIDGGLLHAVDRAIGAAQERRAELRRPTRIAARAAKREAVRQIVTAAFDEHRLDAMAYPTMRRKPALIGEAQGGSNCSLSAVSGFPRFRCPPA